MDTPVVSNGEQDTFQYSSVDKNLDSTEDKNTSLAKDITMMNFEDLQVHFFKSGLEFSSKVQENFKRYVFIAASTGLQNLEEVVKNMAIFTGYQKHKTVGCSKRIYHLYVKYETESTAIAARDYFRRGDFHAEVLYDMLHLWYAFEAAFGLTKCETIGWLTISDDSFITSQYADIVLGKYGNPDIKAVVDKSVQVSFNSIAEAFAACIALGPWYCDNKLSSDKYYSMKIELSEHCSRIMSMCNMTDVASDFDYFVQKDANDFVKADNVSYSEIQIDQKAHRYGKRPHWNNKQKSKNYRNFQPKSVNDSVS